MAEFCLTNLPTELISNALEYAGFKDLLALRLTCRRLRELIADSSELQYIIELAAAGMRDGTTHDPSFTAKERLERLNAYEAALSNFALTEFLLPDSIGWSTVNGDIVVTKTAGRNTSTITVYRMPSPLRGVDFRRWELKINCRVRDFYLDSTQDLLVLVPWPTHPFSGRSDTVRVFSLSTGIFHPSCVTWSGKRNVEGFYKDVDICGDYIAATVAPLSDGSYDEDIYLSIWNWKTGAVEAESLLPLSARPSGEFPDVRFLNEYYIIVLADHYSSVRGGLGPHLQVYTFRRPPPSCGEDWGLDLRCKFLLPELEVEPDDMVEARFLESNSPCWSSGSREPGLFHPDRDRLLGIRFMVNAVGGYGIYIPARILLNRVPSDEATFSTLPWGVWGFHYVHVREGARRIQDIYGTNTIAINKDADYKLCISDYHPLRVGRAQYPHGRSRQETDTADVRSVVEVGPPRIVREAQLPNGFRGDILDFWFFDGCIMTKAFVGAPNPGPATETQILLLSASPASTT